MAYKKISGIYKITNIINKKVYIGQSRNIKQRWAKYRQRLRMNVYENSHLQRAWNKYGEENFKFEIILECPDEDLNKQEIRLIKQYGSLNRDFGYNISEGGRGHKQSEETKEKLRRINLGRHHTKEARKKISEASKGRKLSQETRIRIGQSQQGEKHWNYGGHLSEEAKKKLSNFNKGNKYSLGHRHSNETKEKIRIASTGRKHTEDAKRKVSESKMGIKRSEETKRKISKSLKGRQHNSYQI